MRFRVIDNVTGDGASRWFPTEDEAVWVCRGLNTETPGGRYGVKSDEKVLVPLTLSELDLIGTALLHGVIRNGQATLSQAARAEELTERLIAWRGEIADE